MKVGIYSGSFDPITHSHTSVIADALKLVERLVIAVIQNFEKEPFFGLPHRVLLIKEALSHRFTRAEYERISVVEIRSPILLTKLAEDYGAQLLIRGIRKASDLEREVMRADINRGENPELPTVLIPVSQQYRMISSSLIRELAMMGSENLCSYVCPAVEMALRNAYGSSLW